MTRTTRTMTAGTILALLMAVGWPGEALAAKKILRLRLDGPVMEKPNDMAGLMSLFGQESAHTLREWVKTIRAAAADREINGLALIIEEPQMSLAQVEELTRALQAFRSKGKPVYCYMDYAGNLSYALASAADRITLAENSELAITGLHAQLTFFKGMMDKIGVEAEMLHCGAYKSALEPFTRTEPSPEAAENVNWLLDSLFERWVELIAKNRGLTADEVRQLVDAAPLTAQQALEHKLVDEVSSFGAYKKMIQKEFGKDVEVLKKYQPGQEQEQEVDLENPFALFGMIAEMFKGGTEPTDPGVGLIYVDGGIMVGKDDRGPFSASTAGSTTIRAALEQARTDDKIRAVVMRIDSPGGSVVASDIIWDAAKRCAEEKPLVVSMGAVAGSGGYYVAVPADTIFAEASTITGSIGVVGGKIVWKGLMEGILGITTTEFSRGKHAGLMSFDRKWNDDERKWITDYMNATYTLFKGRVTSSRGDRLKKDIDELAGGRVYTGEQALKLGLVDKLGGLSEAIDFAATKAALAKDCPVYSLPKASEFVALFQLLQHLGQPENDEFELKPKAALQGTSLLRAALPLLRELAPEQVKEVVRGLRNLATLQQERVGCFMPIVPVIR